MCEHTHTHTLMIDNRANLKYLKEMIMFMFPFVWSRHVKFDWFDSSWIIQHGIWWRTAQITSLVPTDYTQYTLLQIHIQMNICDCSWNLRNFNRVDIQKVILRGKKRRIWGNDPFNIGVQVGLILWLYFCTLEKLPWQQQNIHRKLNTEYQTHYNVISTYQNT